MSLRVLVLYNAGQIRRVYIWVYVCLGCGVFAMWAGVDSVVACPKNFLDKSPDHGKFVFIGFLKGFISILFVFIGIFGTVTSFCCIFNVSVNEACKRQ